MHDKHPWAVLWDVDGTLVDTAELHFQAWLALAREIGRPYTRQDFAGTFGWRNAEILPKVFGLDYNAKGCRNSASARSISIAKKPGKAWPCCPASARC